jgi:TonB family protein
MLLLLIGCRPADHGADPSDREVVVVSTLPRLSPVISPSGLVVNALFRVLDDGAVADVRLLGSSGEPDWDRAAIDSMKRWRFAPARDGSSPNGLWIRKKVVVQPHESIVMTLGELSAATRDEADSLYLLLQQRTNLDTLFVASLVTTDIGRYPSHVRDELKRLRENGVTRPLRVGGRFVIYKRFVKSAAE